ncbi:symplekin scaffold protein [Arctopsyche grandis]|uniref:symplekin scaffold protein n=1 Tax=Arctopsyche grandis TaxID=121162 RepID=UPI00406D6451
MAQNMDTEDATNGSPETQVVEWINQLDFSAPGKKVNLLRKIQELLIHQCPHALPGYLDDVLCHVNDRNQDVKKLLIGFMEEISKIKIELLPRMLGNLQLLLMDASVQVQKRVIQAANIVYKNAFVWICSSSDQDDNMEKSWNILNHIKLNILNMVDCENEGIRTNSIKFLEGIIILQTYRDENCERKSGDYALDDIPPMLSFIQRRTLEEESNHIFNLLLKFHNSQHISGVNLMACMSALCEVAKLRPKFLPKVIQSLSSLNSSLPPTLSQSQANSVKKHLKMQILNLVKHSSTNEMLPQLYQILTDLGMTTQELAKALPKGDRRYKRLLDIKNGEGVAKRARIDSPQSNSQSSDKSDVSAHFEPTNEDAVDNVTEKSLLEGLKNIDSVVNLVIVTMKNVPDEIPQYFPTLYEPISKSGVIVQQSSLAKLLMHVIKLDSKDASATDTAKITDEEERAKLKNALAKLESSKLESKIESVLNKMIDDNKNEESARDKEVFSSFDKDKGDKGLICPPTPTIPKLKQRVKTIKLHEVTKPLSREVREKLINGAVERVLRAERPAQEGGATASRMKMLATFAVSFGDQVRETILSFILDDIASRIDLALSWLYEEYCFIQGFNRKIVGTTNASKIDEKSFQNYNNVLCALITDIAELTDPSQEILRENLFRRVYLEAPFITGDALQYLKQVSIEPDKHAMGLNLLRDLIMYQPPKATKHISALLPLTIVKDNTVREAAIDKVVSIYKQPNEFTKKAIDKHAYLHLGFIALPDPPRDLMDIGSDRPIVSCIWDDDLYKVCLQLYLSLLPHNDELLVELCRVYVSIGADGKRCVLRLLEAPVRLLGHNNAALLSLIEECPKGAETLVTRVIHILTEKSLPSPELVSRVRDLYAKKVPDVRFLIPVINGLTKAEILSALPKLIKLNPNVVKEAFNKILYTHGEHRQSPVSPAELLVALHLIDTTKTELKFIIKATSMCFSEKQIYTCEVLGEVLHELVDQPQLPVLLMRTVLQAMSSHPTRLSSLVVSILHRLINKQIWEEKVVWVGFLKCCQRLNPQSLSVVTMLPPEPLRLLLTACPDISTSLRQALPSMTNILPHVNIVLSECSREPELNSTNNIEMLNKIDTVIDVMIPNEPLPPGMD